jgi:DNA-3-methyladenine glycosylase II
MIRSLTPDDYPRARRLLMRRDPVLAVTIKRIGACGLPSRQHPHHLSALVGAIVSQQVSTRAAAAIFARVQALMPEGRVTSSTHITALDDATLRKAGLSGQKVKYLRDLCERIDDGRLKLDELDDLADEEVIERLTAVKGFGLWTAQMFLMFRLQRPDVLPVGDLGIVTAMQRLYKFRKKPDPKRMLKIGEAWRPYRSVACWYLWQSLRIERGEA